MASRFDRLLLRCRPGTPGVPSEAAVRFFLCFMRPIIRLAHRPSFVGSENLPEHGPYLLVANHSGGLGIAEINTFIVSWLERFGTERPIAGMAHVYSFATFPTSRILPAIGAIPSTREHAEAALAVGTPVLVFPGGDHETLRPLSQAHRVDFGGRKGFLRIARAMAVPIVPLGIRGGHFTAPMLFRVPRMLTPLFVFPWIAGGFRWSVSLLALLAVLAIVTLGGGLWWPVQVLLCWAALGSPLALMPWIPATIRMRIGAPMAPADLFGGGGDDDEVLRRAYARVVGAVQGLVDEQV